jgi:hypothetical protein
VRVLLIGLLLFVVGCSEGELVETTSAPSSDPGAVVGGWLEAVAATDTGELQALVEPVGLAVLAGVENRLRSDEMAALLEAGIPDAVVEGYWRSFRDDFAAIRGYPLSAVEVGDVLAVTPSPDHKVVEISSDEQKAVVVLRESATAGLQVDMVATVGANLAPLLREYLESALGGEEAQVIGDAYRSAVVPGLEAAVALDPGNAELVFETEFLRQLVGS